MSSTAQASNVNLEQGFASILCNCLEQIRANEAGLLSSADPEFVHQMRVGLRRLRSALGLFKRWFALPSDLSDEITWLSHVLGAVRDAEVLAHTTLPAISQASPNVPLLALEKAAQAGARQRRSAAAKAVKSRRYQTLMARLALWIEERSWRESGTRSKPMGRALAGFAQRLLSKRVRKVRSQIRLCLRAQATASDRHRLRIAVKKARYAIEFFGGVVDTQDRPSPASLAKIQKLLGQLNDAEVGTALLQMPALAGPALLLPSAFVRGALWAQSQQLIAELPALLRGFGPLQDHKAHPTEGAPR
ncbi:CHAD domain-containing protein [Paucibacter sp. AS339]|uniref:CHAD domain-containing protein n=1 Tax=Paucibacter hankyongi TaxID=3133434 RepID=UPI0030B0C954